MAQLSVGTHRTQSHNFSHSASKATFFTKKIAKLLKEINQANKKDELDIKPTKLIVYKLVIKQ